MSKEKIKSDFDRLEYGKIEKIFAGIIPEYGVSASAWKSPLQLREWFCAMDLNLEKNETNDADTLTGYNSWYCNVLTFSP